MHQDLKAPKTPPPADEQWMGSTVWLIGGFLSVALVLGGVGIGLMVGASADGAQRGSTPVIRVEEANPRFALSRTVTHAEGYVPTSTYVEKGLDPEITRIIFKEGEDVIGASGGVLAPDTFQEVVTQRTEELMGCYVRGLKRDPDLRGQVGLHFRVAPDGHVAVVKVTRSELRTKRVEDCFVEKARVWTFPTSEALARFDTTLGFYLQ